MMILVLISLTTVLALLDIAMKSVIEGYLKQGEERTTCGGRLILRKVYNRGFCLNVLEKKPQIVKYVSAFTTVILTIYQLCTLLGRGKNGKKIGLSLLAAGAWSNTFDRWGRGYVIDYIGIQTGHEKMTRITYNLGDFCIAAGGVTMVLADLLSGLLKSGRRTNS